MGSKQSNKSGIKVDNFGKEEYVDFKLNVWVVVDSDRKNFLKRLIGNRDNLEENISEMTHEINKQWKFKYFEKKNDQNMKDLLLKNVLEKIKMNIFSEENNNVIIIFIKEFDKKQMKELLIEILKQEFREHHQPFLLFISEKENPEIKQDNMIDLLNESAKEYINNYYNENIDNNNENNIVNNENNDIDNENNVINNENNDNKINNKDNKNNEEQKQKNNKEFYLKNFDVNQYYMPYNIFICNYDENENDNIKREEKFLKIQNLLIEFAYCYNELGDAFIPEGEEFSFNFINILCVGRTNSGKSTFINAYFNKRKCVVGSSGLSTNKRVCFYNDFKRQIRFYDTVGFEGPTKNQKTKEVLDKLKINLININQRIHLILYFLGDANFEENEYDIFDEILEYKAHIIFIKNKADSDGKRIYKIEKEKLQESLQKLTQRKIELTKKESQKKGILDKYKHILNCKYENLILMNLRRKELNDSFTSIFGMKKLFFSIYNYLKDQKIDMENLKKLKSINEKNGVYSAIKDNLFLGSYSKKEDILNSLKNAKMKIIAKNAFYAVLSGIDPFPFVDFGTFNLV